MHTCAGGTTYESYQSSGIGDVGKAGPMIRLSRRHSKNCRGVGNLKAKLGDKFTAADTRAYTACKCPIRATGTLGGHELRKSMKTRDWTKANQIIQKWEAEEQATTSEGPVTLDEAWLRIHEDFDNGHLSKETIRKYRYLEKQMKAFAVKEGLRLVKNFNLDNLSRFQSTWTDGPLARDKKVERVQRFFKFARERKDRWSKRADRSPQPRGSDCTLGRVR
jgi:hypothetical protein